MLQIYRRNSLKLKRMARLLPQLRCPSTERHRHTIRTYVDHKPEPPCPILEDSLRPNPKHGRFVGSRSKGVSPIAVCYASRPMMTSFCFRSFRHFDCLCFPSALFGLFSWIKMESKKKSVIPKLSIHQHFFWL